MIAPVPLTPVHIALAGVVLLLILATTGVALLRRTVTGPALLELRLRVRTWWIMVAVFGMALVLGRGASLAFLGLLSFLALREYLSIVPLRSVDRSAALWVYLLVLMHYGLVAAGQAEFAAAFTPVAALAAPAAALVCAGETKGFLPAAACLLWGAMVTVFGLGHLALLVAGPPEAAFVDGRALMLYLVVVVQFGDVVQFVAGKTLGRRPVVPRVSPRKTWEGLAAGLAATTILGGVLAPWLTPLSGSAGIAVGFVVGSTGFLGDVTLSALKRHLGLKDTGVLLPGHGGVLDRVDSLIFAAPVFYHVIRLAA